MLETIAAQSAVTISSTGLVARLVGVLTSPRATYAQVAARPRWLGAMAVVLVVSIATTLTFFSTNIGRQALLDQQIRSVESFGQKVGDLQYQRLEQMASYSAYFVAAAQLAGLPLMALVVTAIVRAGSSVVLDGDATFSQVFAVVTHSGVIVALQHLFVLPLDYARESLSSPTNLAVFLPFLDDTTFFARLLGAIDLFVIWWTVSLAIGLAVVYRRRTAPIAAASFAMYIALAVTIAVVKTALSGA